MTRKPLRPLVPLAKSTDQARLARNPEKACRRCGRVFPNDRKHFAHGQGGIITRTCIECWHDENDGKPDKDTRRRCQVCRELHDSVVVDHHGERALRLAQPTVAPPLLCKRCLMTVNVVMKLPTEEAFQRWMEYATWRWKVWPWTRE